MNILYWGGWIAKAHSGGCVLVGAATVMLIAHSFSNITVLMAGHFEMSIIVLGLFTFSVLVLSVQNCGTIFTP